MQLNYQPSRAGDLFECAVCGAYMPCKKVRIGHIETVVCVSCLGDIPSVKEIEQ